MTKEQEKKLRAEWENECDYIDTQGHDIDFWKTTADFWISKINALELEAEQNANQYQHEIAIEEKGEKNYPMQM